MGERLLGILRDLALRNQKEQPQPFYSVRDIARQFRVPLSTVAEAYHHLQREGLLSSVRSSKTILQGSHYDRRLSVRAFIGLPASLAAFITIQDYRMFFIRIRRELRIRGFATAMLFFEPEELSTDIVAERLKAYEVDTVLWFLPALAARQTALRLSDAGVRLLGITQGEPSTFHCQYELRRRAAIVAILSQWKLRHAVSKITIVESKGQRSAVTLELLKEATESLELGFAVVTLKSEDIRSFIATLRRVRTDGIVFSSSALASRLAFRDPLAVTEIMSSQRVAFLEGPVNMPFSAVPDVAIDLVTFDWQLVAERIVDDLVSQAAFRAGPPIAFEAEAHLRVPLRRFAQRL